MFYCQADRGGGMVYQPILADVICEQPQYLRLPQNGLNAQKLYVGWDGNLFKHLFCVHRSAVLISGTLRKMFRFGQTTT